MYIDEKIFNEIIYIKPTEQHRIYHGDNLPNDYEAIEQLLCADIGREPGESEEAYADRIDQEFENYPMLGVIPDDSLLEAALTDWQYSTRCLAWLNTMIDDDSAINNCCYFWTRDSNYDAVEIDLLHGDGSGKVKQKFIDTINKDTTTGIDPINW